MRGHVLLLVLLAGCSSKKDEPADPPPDPPAETKAPAAEDDARERACRTRGQADVCAGAAQNAYDHKRPELAYELYELACIHGDAASCVKRAEQTRTPALWHGMACRRGATDACALADPWARSIGERLSVSGQSPGLGGARLATVYRHTVADCFAQSPTKERDAAAEMTIEVTLAGPLATEVKVESGAGAATSCVQSAATRWRFPDDAGAGPHSASFTLSAAPPADPE